MFRGGKGMGGGGGGGRGGLFRTFGAAGRTKVVTPKPSTTTTDTNPSSSSSISATSASLDDSQKQNQFSLSSPAQSFPGSAPIIATSGLHWPSNSCVDDFDWVSVDEFEGDEIPDFEKFVASPVPSSDEVETAFSALQHYGRVVDYPNLARDEYSYSVEREIAEYIPSPNDSMRRGSSDGSVSDWIEPSMNLYASGVLHPYGTNKAYDAFHLLRTDPCIKKMVISLSSDKAVWDAVLNNEVVRELRESYYTVDRRIEQISDEKSDDSKTADNIVKWIFDNTVAKMMEVMEKISKIVNELFSPPPSPEGETTAVGGTDPFKEKLRTSFLLSVLVMVIVVVGRAGARRC